MENMIHVMREVLCLTRGRKRPTVRRTEEVASTGSQTVRSFEGLENERKKGNEMKWEGEREGKNVAHVSEQVR